MISSRSRQPKKLVRLINFERLRLLSETCNEALRYQSRALPDDIKENSEIYTWLEEQIEAAGSLSDEWYTTKSAEVHKREEDHSDIRHVLTVAMMISPDRKG